MKPLRSCSILLAMLLVIAGACSRDEGAVESGEDTPNTDEPGGSDDGPTSIDAGGFGDLEAVCSDGDASGATARGVTDTEIHVGTMTDKGYAGAPGLNEEMYDAAVAFAAWCNEHGGILGREIVVGDLDVKLQEYESRVSEACDRDFALVGGGAVFDEDPNKVRVGCDLPNIAGYVVSAAARTADLQVQPIPNPVDEIALGRYRAAAREFPDSIDRYAVMAASLPAVLLTRDQYVAAAESMDFTVAHSIEYAPAGETGWPNFVAELEARDIRILDYVGQPADFVALTQAMDTAGWAPDVVLLSTNFYDSKYAEEGGSTAPNMFIQSAFHPFELADDNKATADYLEILERYNPDGKVATLGTQSMSAFLLFARAATACGSELTPECLLEEAENVSDWTAGGLHAPTTPGNTVPPACSLLLGLEDGEFVYLEEATAPTDGDGLFNCDPENVVDVSSVTD